MPTLSNYLKRLIVAAYQKAVHHELLEAKASSAKVRKAGEQLQRARRKLARTQEALDSEVACTVKRLVADIFSNVQREEERIAKIRARNSCGRHRRLLLKSL